MSVEITALDPDEDRDRWNRIVERADRTNPFYRGEAITLQAKETGTTPHLLVGYKGEEPVGLFPVFEYRRGPVSGAFSPAPYSWSIYLGPAPANLAKLKRRKADRRVRRFLEGSLAWIDEAFGPVYSQFDVAAIADVRAFEWAGYDVSPSFTYVVDLEGDPEELLATFSSDARSNVRSADGYVVTEGDRDDVARIVEQVRARYRSQGKPFHLTGEFARSLYDALPEGRLRPYVCLVDGEFVGGILIVESATTRYRWQGGVKTDVELPVNDVLDWEVMRDGLEAGLDRYDLVGAGVPSINRYKAKFNPRLEGYYTVTGGSYGVDLLVDRYRKLR